ncbi:MAG: hypothetical protein ABWK00_05655 [Desulfurococcaceae archaeon]
MERIAAASPILVLMSTTFINSATWGFYYSFTRYHVGVVLKGGAAAIGTMAGLEWALSLASLASSAVSSLVGFRGLVLLGLSGVLPFALALPYADNLDFLVLALPASSAPWALAWPAVLAMISHESVRSGRGFARTYSISTLFTGIGYGMGSFIAGAAYDALGPRGGLALLISIYASIFVQAYALLLRMREYPERRTGKRGAGSNVSLPFIIALSSVALTVAARETYYAIVPSKLERDIRKLTNATDASSGTAFSIFYSVIASSLSIPARLLAGPIVSALGPRAVMAMSTAAWMLDFLAFSWLDGLPAILAWMVPVYPFFDTSLNTYAAGFSDDIPGSFGMALAATSLGGLSVAILAFSTGLDVDVARRVVVVASLMSLVALAASVLAERMGKKVQGIR